MLSPTFSVLTAAVMISPARARAGASATPSPRSTVLDRSARAQSLGTGAGARQRSAPVLFQVEHAMTPLHDGRHLLGRHIRRRDVFMMAKRLELLETEIHLLRVYVRFQDHPPKPDVHRDLVDIREHDVLLDGAILLHRADRHRVFRVLAAGLREHDAPTRRQDAVHLGQCRAVIVHVVERVHADDSVEAAGAKWQRHSVSRDEAAPIARTARIEAEALAPQSEYGRIDIDRRRGVSEPVQKLRDETRARGEVENPGAGPQIETPARNREVEHVPEPDVVTGHVHGEPDGVTLVVTLLVPDRG